jgi:5'-deoxynucleotidase YfbR-like HD superfamily hydrolase
MTQKQQTAGLAAAVDSHSDGHDGRLLQLLVQAWNRHDKDYLKARCATELGLKVEQIDFDGAFQTVMARLLLQVRAEDKLDALLHISRREFPALEDDLRAFYSNPRILATPPPEIDAKSLPELAEYLHEFAVCNFADLAQRHHSCPQHSMLFHCLLGKLSDGQKAFIAYDPNKDIFLTIAEHILRTNSSFPLRINGYPGSGKTSFLIRTYFALHDIQGAHGGALVIYIDLAFFRSPSRTSTSPDSGQLLERYLGVLRRFSHAQDPVVILVDGLDEYREPAPSDISILQTISNLSHRTRTIVSHRRLPFDEDEGSMVSGYPNEPDEPEVDILLSPVRRTAGPRLRDFISSFLELKASESLAKNPNIPLHELEHYVANIDLDDIDLFTLDLIVAQWNWITRRRPPLEDFSSVLSNHLSKQARAAGTTLMRLADHAYRFLYKIPQVEALPHESIANLAQKHTCIRDFLIAYTVHRRQADSTDLELQTAVLDRVYTHDINKYCKALVTSSLDKERSFTGWAHNHLSKLSTRAKCQVCYLLGRLRDAAHKERAARLLQSELEANEAALMKSTRQEDYLLLRTIYISLIFLGDYRANVKYLTLLLQDKRWDLLNRGFHLEYYGDIPYRPTADNLVAKDDPKWETARTFDRLFRKLTEHLENRSDDKLWAVELHTLCSLVISRMAAHRLKQSVQEPLALMIASVLNPQSRVYTELNAHLPAFMSYLETVAEILPRGNDFTPLFPLFRLYRLKCAKRMGWIRRFNPAEGMGSKFFPITRDESVAEHVTGCMLLADFLLPDDSQKDYFLQEELIGFPREEIPRFHKATICRMLRRHDYPEHRLGDMPSPEKTKDIQYLEHGEMRRLQSFGGIPGLFSDPAMSSEYSEFENENSQDINVRVARDLDKLENLVQLLLYYERFTDKGEFDRFAQALFRVLTSPFGATWATYMRKEMEITQRDRR